ncbi:MAG: hypothetical protein ACLT5G_14910 [Blautia wexlerae]
MRKVSDLIDQIGRVTANSADDLRQAELLRALENDETKRLVSNYTVRRWKRFAPSADVIYDVVIRLLMKLVINCIWRKCGHHARMPML